MTVSGRTGTPRRRSTSDNAIPVAAGSARLGEVSLAGACVRVFTDTPLCLHTWPRCATLIRGSRVIVRLSHQCATPREASVPCYRSAYFYFCVNFFLCKPLLQQRQPVLNCSCIILL